MSTVPRSFERYREVPSEVIDKSYTLGASHCEVIWNVIVPQIIPKFLDTVRLQIGPAVVYLIAAEMLKGDAGFGYRIRMRQRVTDMSVVYTYLALLSGAAHRPKLRIVAAELGNGAGLIGAADLARHE